MGALCTASARGGQALLGELPDQDPHKQLLDAEKLFCDWVADASPGQRLEYYRGLLAYDRMPSTRVLPEHVRRALVAVANRVMQVAEDGFVLPVQYRHADDDYSYVAIKTRHRRAGRERRIAGARPRCRH